ncbi:hypothetical protein NQ317_016466 [Molorchus minor]|uniref:Uncharacterized protein n=1 Tax=Molorchus minor TaxID=1323400 RepID=A0ABQ9JZU2_9CUCU|nr:hypothetical protein NQ317_016466 [Molorchus minor]
MKRGQKIFHSLESTSEPVNNITETAVNVDVPELDDLPIYRSITKKSSTENLPPPSTSTTEINNDQYFRSRLRTLIRSYNRCLDCQATSNIILDDIHSLNIAIACVLGVKKCALHVTSVTPEAETCVCKGDGNLQFIVKSERLIRDNF